jgi:pyrroloquinoline quinone biosynthesis protein E
MDGAPRPYTLVAELTYRCPLRCAYCSNPTRLARQLPELTTEEWRQVFREAERLGVVQLNLTGGEPLLRPDLQELVSAASGSGLYVNLITSGLPLSSERMMRLGEAGLASLQISLQDVDSVGAERVAGSAPLVKKLAAARAAKSFGLALTLNIVVHRLNIDRLAELLELAEELEPERIELANAQYLGWALLNRETLLPSADQLEHAREVAVSARQRLHGCIEVLYVAADYHTGVPRPCMGGWARQHIVVSPDGFVLPCHAAHTIADLQFDNVRDGALERIWRESRALNAFRGEDWMLDPCRSCERRAQDFGGCRCQAFHLIGNARATDPACRFSPHHGLITAAQQAARGSGRLLQLRIPPTLVDDQTEMVSRTIVSPSQGECETRGVSAIGMR